MANLNSFGWARVISSLAVLLLTFPFSSVKAPSQSEDGELTFEIKHRVTAHGDEFNALAKNSDGQRLFIGTEKGEIIVWNIASQRAEHPSSC